jgi:outer membrane protein assembly factor BamB
VKRLAIGVLAVFLVPTTGTAVAANWGQFGQNPWHSSYNSAETKLTRSNVHRLHLAWAYRDPYGGDSLAQPVVVGGIVVTGATHTPDDLNDQVVGLSANTGTRLWSSQTSDGSGLDSLVAGNGEVVADDDEGEAATYKLSSGAIVRAVDGVDGAFTLSGSEVFRGGGGVVWSFPESFSGPPVWETTIVPGSQQLQMPAAPAVSNGTVYALDSGYFAGLNATTGALRWDLPVNANFSQWSAPAMSDHGTAVYFGGRYLYARNSRTGAAVWTQKKLISAAAPAIAGSTVYVSDNETPNGGLTAVSANTGKVLWRNKNAGTSNVTPTVANGVVYDIGLSGKLYMVNSATGKTLAVFSDPHGKEFDQYAYDQPVVVNGTVYVDTSGNPPNYLDALRLP